MRTISTMVGILLTVSAAQEVRAQSLPFIKRAVTQQEYVRACVENDMTILNVSCDKIAEAATMVHAGLALKNRIGVADYMRRLETKPCPTNRVTALASVLPDGSVDLNTYQRELREGELCLYDNQAGIYFVSLSCGNIINSTLPVYTARAEESQPKPEPAPPSNLAKAAEMGGQEIAREAPPAVDHLIQKGGGNNSSRFGRWFGRNRKWVIPTLVGGAVGGVLLTRKNVNETTVTVTVR